ncbi:hypothetical protein BJ508DRAFT_329192 [Ascobolus immersus RN42]|uniref:SUN domain-containing protein n=1 Tax=Ascobolus immersus RN42 TaxID=1160509 RepID=A0A3N4I150_ASCIM|nr:hypothetical protein BJ508DRAFT_329192 [Ascobolus immersus RN42]
MRPLLTVSFLHLLLATKLTLAVESTCPYQTANYIVHGLPQQCLAEYHKPSTLSATTQTVPPTSPDGRPTVSGATTAAEEVADSPHPTITSIASTTSISIASTPTEAPSQPPYTGTATAKPSIVGIPIPRPEDNIGSPIPETEENPPKDPDVDPDSALDSTHFLSFEEWRAQNLAKAGQGQVHQNIGERGLREPRKRPTGMNNDIDSIGDDAEIDLNFGFGTEPSQPAVGATKSAHGIPEGEIVPPRGQARSKNAGKTGKERFNYASFDCAATVHKTGPGVKKPNAILVETKETYMQIPCGEKNKFIILELCDDILVDTVVLANFEFFSSMFGEFRVSVSDRYPIKASGWKELGVFTGRNSREIQPFMVENPQIWARYMKIDFLSHYGNEYWCNLSLIRVHGTTMMEEFKAQEEAARGLQEDDVEEIVPEVVAEEIKQSIAEEVAAQSTPTEEPKAEMSVEVVRVQEPVVQKPKRVESAVPRSRYPALPPPTRYRCTTSPRLPVVFQRDSQACSAIPVTYSTAPGPAYATKSSLQLPTDHATTVEPDQKQTTTVPVNTGATRPMRSKTELHTPEASAATAEPASSVEVRPPPTKEVKPASPPPPQERVVEKVRRPSNPPAPNPPPTYIPRYTHPAYQPPPPSSHGAPTQDNFFKSIHKRLQTLESDATLSLQYIEEQSRFLRDAFAKMEKLQTAKTLKFMEKLNGTVMNELLLFRRQYDQLHQSTVIALESHRRATSLSEAELTEQLAILAEEVLYQRKFGYVQSFLLLVCILLVLFNQSQTFIESPLLNSVKAQSLSAFRHWESPPNSPPTPTASLRVPNGGMRRQASGLRHMRTQSDTLDLASASSPDLPSTKNGLTDLPTRPTISIPETPQHILPTPYATPSLEFSPPTPPRSQRTTPAGTPFTNGGGTTTPKQGHPRRIATEPPLDAWLEYPTLESVLDGSSPARPPLSASSSGSSHSRNSSLEDAQFGSGILEEGSQNGSSQGSDAKRLRRKRKGLLGRTSSDGSGSPRSGSGSRDDEDEDRLRVQGGSECGRAWSEPIGASRRSSSRSRSDDERNGGVGGYESGESGESGEEYGLEGNGEEDQEG